MFFVDLQKYKLPAAQYHYSQYIILKQIFFDKN